MTMDTAGHSTNRRNKGDKGRRSTKHGRHNHKLADYELKADAVMEAVKETVQGIP